MNNSNSSEQNASSHNTPENNPITTDAMPTVKLDETTIAQASATDSTTNAASNYNEEANTNYGAGAPTSTPLYKRKWALIAAPIVAGALLLGVGGSVGYAMGDNGNTGGLGDRDDRGNSLNSDAENFGGYSESDSERDSGRDSNQGTGPGGSGHGKHSHGAQPGSGDSRTPNGEDPCNKDSYVDRSDRSNLTPESQQHSQNSNGNDNTGNDNNDTESDATQS